MLQGDFTTGLTSFLIFFTINVIAVGLVVYGIYFRRHSRRDLMIAFSAFNIGLFVFMTIISLEQATIGVGFGLFAILSIIRIRSEPFDNTELAYAFVVLVIGLVNAFGVSQQLPTLPSLLFALLLNSIAILLVFFMDHPKMLRNVGQQRVTLDRIHATDESLRADLEQRLHGQILDYSIERIDYVREVTILSVRYAKA
jgi:hypothetical protein